MWWGGSWLKTILARGMCCLWLAKCMTKDEVCGSGLAWVAVEKEKKISACVGLVVCRKHQSCSACVHCLKRIRIASNVLVFGTVAGLQTITRKDIHHHPKGHGKTIRMGGMGGINLTLVRGLGLHTSLTSSSKTWPHQLSCGLVVLQKQLLEKSMARGGVKAVDEGGNVVPRVGVLSKAPTGSMRSNPSTKCTHVLLLCLSQTHAQDGLCVALRRLSKKHNNHFQGRAERDFGCGRGI
ncbi:hypothetical protein P171DRAFT_77655 [Karstenula rhodostoma CBS 690.94]|uniref:Secreted protein n=1 Tax=Karstenula rhodostoma CBS 690.94 TaxID=1392251 RepID=A0A9P4PEZ6_9PLEO|nr:hypothetical protein P171DRAFT_77655 [Karstenula rhodostoma CBS 690.94]